ncbi:transcription intermediary factor 1-beta-like isoform X2 [Oryzias latipes]|uniref:transcription intermediary factor 1-beta-like isoform X2 n=1 Tax=Oryzias latipes TaxID=8090 RepID=UPI000CE1DFED|nr:transcription intermediary factor 1-beta-like isoform X2 [Oryzias latipes]
MTSVDLTEPAEDSPAQKCGSCGGAPVWCWCVDCNEALCHDCVSAHRRVTVTRRHKLLDQAPPEVRSIAPTKFCSLHPSETLQLFCFRCNQMTCRDCQLVAHKNHSFEFISKAVECLKKQLGSSIDPLQEQMQASRRSIVEMEERLVVLSQHETFIKTKLQKNFSALAEFLSRRLEKVLQEVQVHDWERQKIRRRMLKVKQLQQSCMAVTAAAVQAQNLSDLLELLGCMAQIKPQVKDLISQDSAPPKTMACLKVISDQQSMDSILQFGKIEVSWVPFSAYQAPKKDTSCLHEVAPPTSSSLSGVAPPTSSSSISDVAPPTSSSLSGVAPPTSSSSISGIAPPTSSSLSGVAPPTSSSSISGIAPPTSFSFFNGIAPPTSSSSISDIAPPTSFSFFNGIAPPTSSSSISGVAPPTSSSSLSGIAPPTSSSLSGIAPPTSFSFFNGIAPPTFSFKGIAPPTSSSLSGIAPPTSSLSFNGITPPTFSSLSGIAPPPSSSSFNGIAPPTSSSLSGIAPPTSYSFFNGIAPPTFSFKRIAPPNSSSSISGIAPPTSSTCSSFSSETPPPLVSHSSAPSLLSLSSWRHSTYAPPVHTADAPPTPPPAPPDPKKAKQADSVCSSQLAPPFAPLPAHIHPTPILSVNCPAPPPTSLDTLGVTPPQYSPAAASKVRINVISRSEVAALSRLLEWPQKHHNPPKKKPARSSDPQGGRSAAFRKHPPKKTKSSGGASTLLFHSLAPQSKNLTTSSSPPCSLPITPAVTPEPPSQQQPSVFAPGGLAASKPTTPSLPSPPPSTPPSRSALAPTPPYPHIPLKDQEPPHTLQRERASLQPGSFVSPLRPKTPPLPHPSLRDRHPSQEEPSPHPGSCRGGPGSSASEPSEPEAEPAPAFPVEPEPPEKPAPPPATEEPTSAPCGGLDPDGTPVRKLAAGTGGGGAPLSRDSRLLQPRVSLFRLPVSWSGPDRPLPRFQLIIGDAEDEIYMQEISQVETSRPKDSCRSVSLKPLNRQPFWFQTPAESLDFTGSSSTDDGALNDQNPDFTQPLSLEILSCSTCGASDASKICVSCGRGYHRDCHVPPVRPDIWSALTCSLCQDLSDPADPFSSDRPACQTSGLGLLDQRKCETLVLHLLVEGCGRLSESGFLLDLTRISERLTCQRLPGFQRAEDLVSELWTLMEETSQNDALKDLQESFQNKVKEMFGSELLPLLRRTSNSKAPPAGGSSSPKCAASGPKGVDSELPKVRRDGERTGRGSKLEVVRRRLRDFLDMKQLPPGKRMKTD